MKLHMINRDLQVNRLWIAEINRINFLFYVASVTAKNRNVMIRKTLAGKILMLR